MFKTFREHEYCGSIYGNLDHFHSLDVQYHFLDIGFCIYKMQIQTIFKDIFARILSISIFLVCIILIHIILNCSKYETLTTLYTNNISKPYFPSYFPCVPSLSTLLRESSTRDNKHFYYYIINIHLNRFVVLQTVVR